MSGASDDDGDVYDEDGYEDAADGDEGDGETSASEAEGGRGGAAALAGAGSETEGATAEEPDDELGLDEDAAGTDEEEEEREEAEVAPEEELAPPEGPTGGAPKAAPQQARVDPLLRDANKHQRVFVVPLGERVTDNRLQKAEAAAVLAIRAAQIAKHATHFAKGVTSHDPAEIAYQELYQRRCPLTLRRKTGVLPDGTLVIEKWSAREMTLPPLDLFGRGPT
jgi:hypothetical protein